MAAQSGKEVEVRDRFAAFDRVLADLSRSCETDAVRWLRNVKIPAADEGER